jgi:hypothetical protein
MDKKWHYTLNGEYPLLFGEYKNKHYPQISCLVQENNGNVGVRYWNDTEKCWDDEECDDYYCDKDRVERWMYLDPLLDER